MADIADDDIRRIVSRNAFDAGLHYHMSGRVHDVRVSADGSTIEARVAGSQRTPYRVGIRLGHRPGGALTIAGTCTCPVGYNCKHVAAALLAYQEEQLTAPAGASAGAPAKLGVPASPSAATGWRLPAPTRTPPGPPPEIAAWLDAVENAADVESENYPASVRRRMLYVLRPEPGSGAVSVNLVSIELARDGTPGKQTKSYSPHQILQPNQQPKFLRPSDRAIIVRLAGLGSQSGGGEEFVETLRRIVATGRGRWSQAAGPALREGEPVAGELVWRSLDDGTQRPEIALPEGLQVMRLATPWYVDPGSGRIGPVALDMPARLVRAVLAAPKVASELVPHIRAELTRRLPRVRVPAPLELAPAQVLAGPPVPHLRLSSFALTPLPFYGRSGGRDGFVAEPIEMPIARLSFRYGKVAVPAFNRSAPTSVTVDGQLYRVSRDIAGETAAAQRLAALDFYHLADALPGFADLQMHGALALRDDAPIAWIDFVMNDVPALREDGWTIEIADDFPLRLAEMSGEITAEVSQGSGIDWFDLELGAMVDGERIDLLPILRGLFAGMESGGDGFLAGADDGALTFVPLPDGRLLQMPMGKLRPFIATILEVFDGGDVDPDTGRARLSRHRAADLALIEAAGADAGIVWQGGESLRALGRQLRATDGIPSARLPESFVAELRPYQSRGVDWLQFLASAGLGGVLADDMGLGKTVQALAHIAIEHAAGRLDRPALIVCPTSLVANWRAEAARFAPVLRVLALHGPDRAARFSEIADHDVVITTYPLLTRDSAALVEQEWHAVILDEAQTIKNPLANTTKLAGRLRGRQRLCLTGTPIENHLGELWSMFDFLMPGLLGNSRSFQRSYRGPIERGGDVDRRASLARRVAPFLLRRTKAEVAADLPAKTEIIEHVEFEDGQRAVYEGIRLTMHAKVKQAVAERGLARSGIIILDALLKLRQACCDPRLLKLATAKAARAKSAKLERLMEMLPELLEEGRRVLLFSQFTSMLALIEEALAQAAIPYVLLTGDTRDRATPIARFQNGEVPLFLISLKAGGVGLNLTAADTVIHYDPWWNPAVEDQATDRAHRIGQDKPVFVHRLITRGTIEEKMETLKSRKQALVAGILGGSEARALAITEEDIEALLASSPG